MEQITNKPSTQNESSSMKKPRTLVISAFPACGKSYMYNNFNGKQFTMIDSDSSKFSWIYKDGKKTNERNPNFIDDYINHIKSNIGKVDIIFVSSHKNVRQALRDNGIKYIIIHPSIDMKEEMLKRMKERGNDEAFIKFQEEHFEEFVNEIMDECSNLKLSGEFSDFTELCLTNNEPYITNSMISSLTHPIFGYVFNHSE